MEGGETPRTATWRSLRRRLRFTGMACCGSPRSHRVPDSTISDEEAQLKAQAQFETIEDVADAMAVQQGRWNLAMALAAERGLRRAAPAVEVKTLVTLFEEADGRDVKSAAVKDGRKGSAVGGVCGVCEERNRGAALIPCGHTYCRACSREMWLNGGSCPLCNRLIHDTLAIF